jgi:hypothetical protein
MHFFGLMHFFDAEKWNNASHIYPYPALQLPAESVIHSLQRRLQIRKQDFLRLSITFSTSGSRINHRAGVPGICGDKAGTLGWIKK